MKMDYKIYYVGNQGKEIFVYEDGTKRHGRLTSAESKELKILIKADKFLDKMSNNHKEREELKSIPYTTGLQYLEVWKVIDDKKLKPLEAKEYLLGLLRYHGLLWRG